MTKVNRKTFEPNWQAMEEARSSIHGGHLEDIPKPHIKHSSSPLWKRYVTVSVSKFICGSHYWVRITEEDDALWNSRESSWQKPWESTDLGGRSFSKDFKKPEQAQRFINETLKKEFAGDRYEIDHQSKVSDCYGKEGD